MRIVLYFFKSFLLVLFSEENDIVKSLSLVNILTARNIQTAKNTIWYASPPQYIIISPYRRFVKAI